MFVQTQIKPRMPAFLPPVKPGQTRIEMTCKCGQKIIDDYTEQNPGGISRFREELKNFSSTRYPEGSSVTRGLRSTIPYLASVLSSRRAGHGFPTACTETAGMTILTSLTYAFIHARVFLVQSLPLRYILITLLVDLVSVTGILAMSVGAIYVLMDIVIGIPPDQILRSVRFVRENDFENLKHVRWGSIPGSSNYLYGSTKMGDLFYRYRSVKNKRYRNHSVLGVWAGIAILCGVRLIYGSEDVEVSGNYTPPYFISLLFAANMISLTKVWKFARSERYALEDLRAQFDKVITPVGEVLDKIELSSSSGNSSPTSANSSSGTRFSVLDILKTAFGSKSKSADDSECGLPQHNLASPGPLGQSMAPDSSPSPLSETLFLLLCYPSGRYATRLLQLDLNTLKAGCDQTFFTLLSANYRAMRSIYSLKRLQSIEFVKFEVYQNDLVEVRGKDYMPPKDNTEYRYMPKPLDVLPPVGPNLMMHLVTHPDEAATVPKFFLRLPKKLHGPLDLSASQDLHPSWGLQYVESWDVAKLWIITLMLFGGGSLLWGILWAVYKHSVQDAFAVSAYVVAMVGVFGGSGQAMLLMS